MWPQRLQIGREHPVGAEQRLDAHRRGHVGRAQEPPHVVRGEEQHAEHAVGAVDEGEPLLLGKLYGLEAGITQRVGGGRQRTVGRPNVAFAHQGERTMRQWRQVTGAAEASVFADDGGNPRVEHRGVGRRRGRPYAGAAGGER